VARRKPQQEAHKAPMTERGGEHMFMGEHNRLQSPH
jgi:hypothetical protein